MTSLRVTAGHPAPLGAVPDDQGVNFAVFSAHATRITVCLFDASGAETARLDLPEHSGGVWHGHVAGIGAGQHYGLRADGPYAPSEGHRFNAAKLLIDPYARRLNGPIRWHPCQFGGDDTTPDPRDSAAQVPSCIVVGEVPVRPRPGIRAEAEVIYEAHAKGLTALHPDVAEKGKIAGLAEAPIVAHLKALGVTAIELLPVHAFADDRHLVERGLTNYWGYQTLGFFAPEPRYLTRGDPAEMRETVASLQAAGLKVFLDVVYNHTGEGDETGPTLCFRGLDNASYYRLQEDRSRYVNDTGTGNTLDTTQPFVLRMVMDSLRYWSAVMGADGFRFDLCATLGRTAVGFDPDAPLLQAIRQDPDLSQRCLIAEPWDIGPGGYQLGAFPPPFLEWNDRSRDTIRRFWRGDPGQVSDLAGVLAGSAGGFDRAGRSARSSVNFVTAHDGFTLEDVVSYSKKHNEANGEDDRDGHGANYSDNLGVEGPVENAEIRAARDRRKRNMLATLLLAQGTPMLLAGDELGHSQGGNNNAYAQDNDTTWLDWQNADRPLRDFVTKAIAFRRSRALLSQHRFLHGEEGAEGRRDLVWRCADGAEMMPEDWQDAGARFLAMEIGWAAGTPASEGAGQALYLVLNAGPATQLVLPGNGSWTRVFDSTADGLRDELTVAADSIAVFELTKADVT
ncbi:MAG: glycogen debranching protein GlgX [Pseudomonadota bacterium]